MKAIIDLSKFDDNTHFIIIPKIRELTIAMGSVVIVYDNGDRHTIDTLQARDVIAEITEAIENYYK
jgi:membrane protease subunit (stomatin/prohibitin family)